ncbi:two pore domain potassium channel family protein [Gloeocapsopsis crepidinum LEGE 06123]|uniref:Two pore domain potassium channel family protein n=1 Tax=Gloeocapsopsis crepidinum LEGE 06123 TaxID=588587 RepID=A0ABR9UM71_9CHRO|nr:potassium channel family protein [Gloeocapsopsis crepidinum]MBE9189125.1 two pore domain potassium channel family protein [Gloeocapsopsis crepidinum LEGE 06123]
MGWLLQGIGTGLVVLAIADIYLTVLYPRGDKGIISVPLARGLWHFFRFSAKTIRTQRDRILSYMGPTLLVATVTVWILLLLIGFALISWVALDNEIQMQGKDTPTDFATAIYYSGYSLSTLGIGDIRPQTGTYRLLMILEAVLGFSVFTITLTYLQSVYNQLIQRNIFALSLHHRTGKTANAAVLLAGLGSNGSFDSSTRQDLNNMAQSLLNILESNHSYPVMGYFRLQESYYALARVVFLTMDTVTLIKSALNEESYRSLIYSAAVKGLEESGMQFLAELAESFLPSSALRVKGQSEQMWRSHYYQAVEHLAAQGIATVANLEAGADLYVSLRRRWNPNIIALAKYMEYDWSAIAPSVVQRVD